MRERSKQRLDSTHVSGCVSEMSRLQVVREALRLVLVEIERNGDVQALPDWESLRERYVESDDVDWRHASKGPLARHRDQAGQDTLDLIGGHQQPRSAWPTSRSGNGR